MTLQEAIKSGLKFQRPQWGLEFVQHFSAGTGDYSDLVSCDYFVSYYEREASFSTSLDLYYDDIFATDYVTMEDK